MGNEDLVNFVESLSGESHLRVQDDLGDGFVRLRAAEAQRRQAQQDIRSVEDVVLELLRNARDAHCKSLFVASWREGNKRHLTVIDDGDGIPETHHEQVFEPFVTSKLDSFRSDRWGVHGRGMALYSIRQNVDDVHIAKSLPGFGSSFVVCADTEKLSEKRDQSSLPTVVKGDSGERLLRGPHNIARTVLEFAIDERENIAVYFGSPTEVAARLYALGTAVVSRSSAVFERDCDSVPLLLSLAYRLDPESFSQASASLGLPMSDRSARRIMDGDIVAVDTVLSQFAAYQKSLKADKAQNPSGASGVAVDAVTAEDFAPRAPSAVAFTEDDLFEFKKSIKLAYADLAQAYYLNPEIDISIKRKNGSLHISIPLSSED